MFTLNVFLVFGSSANAKKDKNINILLVFSQLFVCPVTITWDLQTVAVRAYSGETKHYYLCPRQMSLNPILEDGTRGRCVFAEPIKTPEIRFAFGSLVSFCFKAR